MAHYTVIGLGRFGIAASLELIDLGHTVTGVERDPKIAEKYVDDLTQMVICDPSDEDALEELNLNSSDVVLVAIGEDMESSLLCTLALKTVGVKNIWVKANSKAHHAIVSKLGVERIIHPEEEMGIRVAQALNYPAVNNYLTLGHGLHVIEISIAESLDEVTLGDVLDNEPGSVEAILVTRGHIKFTKLGSAFVLKLHDVLLLCGTRHDLQELAPRLG